MAAGDIVYASDTDQVLDGWTDYAPVWTTTTGTPSVGTTGTLVGRYKKMGKTCTVIVAAVLGGTGISAGTTGGWNFTVPFQSAAIANARWLGSAYLRDSSAGSTGHFTGICAMDQGATTFTVFEASQHLQAQQTAPFTPATGDQIVCEIEYETAV